MNRTIRVIRKNISLTEKFNFDSIRYMENAMEMEKLKTIFEKYPEIKLVYFFGSRAQGDYNSLSDYDFAIYLDTTDKNRIFEIRAMLMDQVARIYKTDKVDVVVINSTQSPEMKYNIIFGGKLIYEKEPYKIILEPKIFNEYFDFRMSLEKNNLVKAKK